MNNNKELYLDKQTTADIITALAFSSQIITLIGEYNKCYECKLLQAISNIINRLKVTSFEGLISLFPIQSSLTDEALCDVVTKNEDCKKVWELLQEMFKNPIIAKDIVWKLKQILIDLQIKLAREE